MASPPVIDAVAHARFLRVEPAFQDFIDLHFHHSRQSELVRALKNKNARLGKLLEGYAQVVAVGSPTWSTASFERIGEAYRNFNKGLLDAPTPRGWMPSSRSCTAARSREQALPLEDKATEAFGKAIQVSQKSGVYSHWALKAQDFLREYQPDAYGDLHRPAADGHRAVQHGRARLHRRGALMRKLVVALLLLVACAHAPRPTPAVDAAAERRRLLELPPAILHKEAARADGTGRLGGRARPPGAVPGEGAGQRGGALRCRLGRRAPFGSEVRGRSVLASAHQGAGARGAALNLARLLRGFAGGGRGRPPRRAPANGPVIPGC